MKKARVPLPVNASLEAIVASTPASVVLLSLDGRYLYANHASRGYGGAEKRVEDVLAPAAAARVRAAIKRIARTRRSETMFFHIRDRAGRPQRWTVALSALVEADRVVGIVAVGVDGHLAPRGETLRTSDAAALAAKLTPKQREVLVLVAEGLSAPKIAASLRISERTVETHREQLMDRLDIRGTAALARFAVDAGLL